VEEHAWHTGALDWEPEMTPYWRGSCPVRDLECGCFSSVRSLLAALDTNVARMKWRRIRLSTSQVVRMTFRGRVIVTDVPVPIWLAISTIPR